MIPLTQDRSFFVWGVVFLVFHAFYCVTAIATGTPQSCLWFCVTLVLLFGIGLITENVLLVSSVVSSGFFLNLPLVIDLLAHRFAGKILIGSGAYVLDLTPFGYAVTFYHVFLLSVPVWAVFRLRRFDRWAWAVSSGHYLALSLLTLALVDASSDVNYVREATDLAGAYAMKPEGMPYWLFHWLMMTFVLILPGHVLFRVLVYLWARLRGGRLNEGRAADA
ncbi:hypothetical protein HAHE_07270 [Haloferula helveola]|uniref:Transmembrane protein n=1 Tax=Haloferula helveola TaxID=490095 RepID=A0ABN6GZW7_9BACT|nr:hypothetical protein HAHE_07270 [Haloferula helveola]